MHTTALSTGHWPHFITQSCYRNNNQQQDLFSASIIQAGISGNYKMDQAHLWGQSVICTASIHQRNNERSCKHRTMRTELEREWPHWDGKDFGQKPLKLRNQTPPTVLIPLKKKKKLFLFYYSYSYIYIFYFFFQWRTDINTWPEKELLTCPFKWEVMECHGWCVLNKPHLDACPKGQLVPNSWQQRALRAA